MRSFAPKLNSSPKPMSDGAARPSVSWTAPTHLNYDFSRIPVHPPAAHAEQTTVAISEPSNQYEQQADRLADQVMFGESTN